MARKPAAVCFVFLFLVPAALLAQPKPPSSFSFALQVPNVGTGTVFFKSCTGLKSETEVVDFQEGGAPGVIHKIAGTTHYSNITLKRGVTSDPSLAQWRKMVEDGQVAQARRNGTIILTDRAGNPVVRWTIVSAWPSAISIEPDPDTGDPLEVITLAVDVSYRQ